MHSTGPSGKTGELWIIQEVRQLNIGAALFMIALGAVLKYAVTASVAGVSLATMGVILMIAGAVGLVAAVIIAMRADSPGPAESRRYPAS